MRASGTGKAATSEMQQARAEGAAAPSSVASAHGLQGLLDALPLGVFTIGKDKSLQSINAEAARLLGVDAAKALGHTCESVFQCSLDGPCCATDDAQGDGAVRHGGPVELRATDGSARVVQIDAVPLDGGEVAVLMRDVTETERLRQVLRDQWVFHGLVGASRGLEALIADVRRIAPGEEPALVVGERGAGKEVLARALHAESPRASEPFVVLKCAGYSKSLLADELFGADGAAGRRPGRLDLARGGTLYLEDLEAVPAELQARLVHALSEAGATGGEAPTVRVLAALTTEPAPLRRGGRLDATLLEYLSRHVLRIPPLRERTEDVPVLVEHLLRRTALRTGKGVRRVSRAAMDALVACTWPGNVSQLAEVVERAVVRCEGDVLDVQDLPRPLPGETDDGVPVQEDRMREALRRAAGSVSHAARLLGVHRTTLWRWMGAMGLRREDFVPK